MIAARRKGCEQRREMLFEEEHGVDDDVASAISVRQASSALGLAANSDAA